MQKSNDWKDADPSTTKQVLTQEDKIDVELIKKIMAENKTALPSLRNQDWTKVMVEKLKIKKIINK